MHTVTDGVCTDQAGNGCARTRRIHATAHGIHGRTGRPGRPTPANASRPRPGPGRRPRREPDRGRLRAPVRDRDRDRDRRRLRARVRVRDRVPDPRWTPSMPRAPRSCRPRPSTSTAGSPATSPSTRRRQTLGALGELRRWGLVITDPHLPHLPIALDPQEAGRRCLDEELRRMAARAARSRPASPSSPTSSACTSSGPSGARAAARSSSARPNSSTPVSSRPSAGPAPETVHRTARWSAHRGPAGGRRGAARPGGVASISSSRSAGCRGSNGTYTPPALSTASSTTTASTPRSRHEPTTVSAVTPRNRSRAANRSDRASSSA
ncbi:hypothetical protein SCANM63S_02423 [Streptomyces canarius]